MTELKRWPIGERVLRFEDEGRRSRERGNFRRIDLFHMLCGMLCGRVLRVGQSARLILQRPHPLLACIPFDSDGYPRDTSHRISRHKIYGI